MRDDVKFCPAITAQSTQSTSLTPVLPLTSPRQSGGQHTQYQFIRNVLPPSASGGGGGGGDGVIIYSLVLHLVIIGYQC